MKTVRVIAIIETLMKERLFKKLASKGMTFSGWLRIQIAKELESEETK